MTKEEAIRNINALNAVCGQKDFYDNEFEEALRMAIQALEQSPCEDAISREATIKYLCTNMCWYDENGDIEDDDVKESAITDLINGIPSVQPKSPWIRIEFKGDALNCPLPDDGERVFLRFKNGYVTTDTCQITIDEEDNTCYGFEDNPDFEDIDAWMKIPE